MIILFQDSPSSCCGVGNCTTPTTIGLYNTIQYRRNIHYSPVAINNILYGHDQSLRPKKLQYSSVIGREEGDNSDIPLLDHNYRTLVKPYSNPSLSDTDTSLISSERDRESEVWSYLKNKESEETGHAITINSD